MPNARAAVRGLLFAAALSGLALGASVAQAAAAKTDYRTYEACFVEVDSNYDDFVTWEEFKQRFPKGEKAVFTEADHDKDGKITHEEWEDWSQKRGLKHE